MERIYGGRGQGKTKRLMEAAAKVGGVIVCRNPVAMKKKAEAYGIIGLDFISYEDMASCDIPEGYPDNKFFVDELEEYMKVHFNTNNLYYPLGYTITLED